MGVGSKILFYPTLGYNVVMKKVTSRRWYDRIDQTVVLGALPLRSNNYAEEAQQVKTFGSTEYTNNEWFMSAMLVKDENVRGVISMNEDYELKRFVTTKEEWAKLGANLLQLPTVDFTEAPSLDSLEQGVNFILDHAQKDESVYVHCKAGRTRSATLVGCYLMHVKKCTPQEAQNTIEKKRSHIIMKDKHFRAMYRFEANTATNQKSLQKTLQPQKERIKYDELMATRESVVKNELELNQKALWSENLEEASEFRKVKDLAAQLKSEIKFASKGLIEVRRAALRQRLEREYAMYEQELHAQGKAFYFKRE